MTIRKYMGEKARDIIIYGTVATFALGAYTQLSCEEGNPNEIDEVRIDNCLDKLCEDDAMMDMIEMYHPDCRYSIELLCDGYMPETECGEE